LPGKEDGYLSRGTLGLLLAGVFLTSFGLLAFEITLARLLSVLLLYHFVFAVVSLALLGLGVGGIFVHLFWPRMPTGDSRFALLALVASLTALAIPVSVILMVQVGYLNSAANNILLYCFLLFIPFFLTGVLLSQVFRMFPELSARIYGADLAGAAIGSLGVILLLDALGGINASFLLGLVVAVAALIFAVKVLKENLRRAMIAITSFLVVAALLGANLSLGYLSDMPIAGASPDKEIRRALSEPGSPARIIETRWSAFGRTDLVGFTGRPQLMNIYIDGTAGTPMYQFSGDLANPGDMVERLKTGFTGYFPFFFLKEEERDNALIIGPGGGRDVLLALMGGVDQIMAVEVNKDLVDIVREYASYNGGIYTGFHNVKVVVDEGRNFLKRQKEKYDLIMLSLPVTQSSRSLEGYALTESFLFTTDSINDYLEHLTDEGRLVVVAHDDVTMWKLLSISLKALEERGVSNTAAFKQIYMLGLSSANIYPLFVLKKTPFSPAEILPRHEKMLELGYDPTLSYFPYLEQVGMVNPLLLALSRGKVSLTDVARNMARELGLDISPASDNSPFFYKIGLGLPTPVAIVLWLSVAMMLLVLFGPPLYRRWRPLRGETSQSKVPSSGPGLLKFVVLFSMLGIGFMLVEISLIQKFILYLGQPVLSMAVLLFSLLVGAGLGSIYSGRLAPERLTRGIASAALAIVAVITAYTFLLSPIFNQLLGTALGVRLLAMVVMLVPLGFLMGFPFPLGIRVLRRMKMEGHIPWMWGINGVGSVLGSALTIAVAIGFGFTQALLLGAGCYLVVFLTFRRRTLRGV